MSDETTTPSDGRVGFRDIYRAVGESEVRIVNALNAAVGPLTAKQADHEIRLRQIEGAVSPLAILSTERDRRLTTVEIQAEANSKAIANFIAREGGVFATLGVGKTIVIIGMAVMGSLIAVADFLARIAS